MTPSSNQCATYRLGQNSLEPPLRRTAAGWGKPGVRGVVCVVRCIRIRVRHAYRPTASVGEGLAVGSIEPSAQCISASVHTHPVYGTFGMQRLIFSAKYRLLVRGVLHVDPKFAQESETELRSRQSPAGKDENCTQSPVSSAVWPAGRLAAGCGSHASSSKSQLVEAVASLLRRRLLQLPLMMIMLMIDSIMDHSTPVCDTTYK
jgi:hypothetical protein